MIKHHSDRLFAAAVATIALFVTAPAAHAQPEVEVEAVQEIAPEMIDDESFYGKEPTQGVYVRDSAVALEKFPLVARLERMNEWGKAADLLQEVLEEFPDRVIQSATNEDGEIIRYTSVASAVTRQIARWPASGLDAYRARFEPVARARLSAGSQHDIVALRTVYWQYFNTQPGLEAGIRLVDLYFRDGDFRSARQIAEQLLELHPLLKEDRPTVLYRAGLLAHLAGDADAAAAHRDELAANYPDKAGLIRGNRSVWAESLDAELAVPPAAARVMSADSWPILGGDSSRARVSTAPGRTGARLFRIPLGRPQSTESIPTDERGDRPGRPGMPSTGGTLGVMPVVDRNELFFQDGRHIYGVSLESGLPLPGWAETHAASGGTYTTDAPPMPEGWQLNVTVTDDAVIAIMGFPLQTARTHGGTMSRIVCLDRYTGRERWVVRPSDLPDQDALRALTFSGSPLVIGDSVYFLGRGGKSTQFEDCYLITLDLKSGEHVWSTYIASAGTQNANMLGRRRMAHSSESTSHIAYAGGRLFVLTNLGAVAAVDAYSGSIDWMSIYVRRAQANQAQQRRFGAQPAVELPDPWTFNPVMVHDGLVFILPTDAEDLFIYDADSGRPFKTLRAAHIDNPDTIVGIHGDDLVVSGGTRIKSINWREYDSERYTDSNAEMVNWPRQFSGSPIRGRPFMTTESIFVPTQRRLHQMDQQSGKIIASHPADTGADWDGDGNIIVTGDRVVVATERTVDVYTDLGVAQAKLDAEVAQSPDDPQVLLRYAEVMFVAGQEALSLEKFDLAIDLLGGRDAMRSGPARERLFHTTLNYAEQLTHRSGAQSPALAVELYDRAAAAAEAPSQQVQYRISRAKLAARTEDHHLVTALHQQILDDPALRLVTINEPRWGGATQAAVVAEQEIAALIRKSGREVYADFDARAEQAVESAAGDANALLAIAAQYPNSRLAPQALLSAAQSFESIGNHRLATQTLRQITHKFPDAFDKARIIEAMVRNYLAMPNRIEVALSRLEHGVRTAGNPRLTQPLTLPDGSVVEDVTFAQVAGAVRAYADRTERRLPPDFHLPTREWGLANRGQSPFPDDARLKITEIDSLVAPMPGFARHDRVVTWSRGGEGVRPQQLAIYPVGQADPLGTTPAVNDAPQQAAWTDAGLLLWTPEQILLLDPDNVSVRWELSLEALPDVRLIETADEPPSAADDSRVITLDGNHRVRIVANRVVAENILAEPQAQVEERFTQAALTTDRALLTTATGRLIAVDLTNGTFAWQSRLLHDKPIDRIIANDDFTVVRVVRGSRVDLIVFDTYSGELLSRRGFAASGGAVPLNFALAADGTLVYVLPDRICGKDLYEPGEQLSWEVSGQAPGQRVFAGATHPDHLKIHNGRVMVISDDGQFVRVHSLQTGRLIRYRSGQRGREVDALLSTGNQDWSTRLVLDGTYMYCVSPRSLVAYNLDNPEQTWRGPNDPATVHNYRDALVGQNYLVLLDAPGQAAAPKGGEPIASPVYTLYVFSRAPTRNGESGLMVHSPAIQDRAGIQKWLGVEGGLYYLAGDRTLNFLKGIRE